MSFTHTLNYSALTVVEGEHANYGKEFEFHLSGPESLSYLRLSLVANGLGAMSLGKIGEADLQDLTSAVTQEPYVRNNGFNFRGDAYLAFESLLRHEADKPWDFFHARHADLTSAARTGRLGAIDILNEVEAMQRMPFAEFCDPVFDDTFYRWINRDGFLANTAVDESGEFTLVPVTYEDGIEDFPEGTHSRYKVGIDENGHLDDNLPQVTVYGYLDQENQFVSLGEKSED